MGTLIVSVFAAAIIAITSLVVSNPKYNLDTRSRAYDPCLEFGCSVYKTPTKTPVTASPKVPASPPTKTPTKTSTSVSFEIKECRVDGGTWQQGKGCVYPTVTATAGKNPTTTTPTTPTKTPTTYIPVAVEIKLCKDEGGTWKNNSCVYPYVTTTINPSNSNTTPQEICESYGGTFINGVCGQGEGNTPKTPTPATTNPYTECIKKPGGQWINGSCVVSSITAPVMTTPYKVPILTPTASPTYYSGLITSIPTSTPTVPVVSIVPSPSTSSIWCKKGVCQPVLTPTPPSTLESNPLGSPCSGGNECASGRCVTQGQNSSEMGVLSHYSTQCGGTEKEVTDRVVTNAVFGLAALSVPVAVVGVSVIGVGTLATAPLAAYTYLSLNIPAWVAPVVGVLGTTDVVLKATKCMSGDQSNCPNDVIESQTIPGYSEVGKVKETIDCAVNWNKDACVNIIPGATSAKIVINTTNQITTLVATAFTPPSNSSFPAYSPPPNPFEVAQPTVFEPKIVFQNQNVTNQPSTPIVENFGTDQYQEVTFNFP